MYLASYDANFALSQSVANSFSPAVWVESTGKEIAYDPMKSGSPKNLWDRK